MTKKLSRIVRYLALLLMASMLISVAIPQNAKVSATAEKIAIAKERLKAVTTGEYELITESKTLQFYMETNLAGEYNGKFALVSKESGAIWFSNPVDPEADNKVDKGTSKSNIKSQIVLDYVNVLDINKNAYKSPPTNSFAMCNNSFGNTGSIKASKREDGKIEVMYDFGTLGFKIPVIYNVADDCFEASIDTKNIDEGDDNRIVNINFLPYFGAANPSQKGYMFIPDGCGAVAEYNSGIIPTTSYCKTIYGDDSAALPEKGTQSEEDIRFPVFGTVVENEGTSSGLFGVITSGDGSARIDVKTANDKGLIRSYYNTVSPQIAYRIADENGQGLYASKGNGEKRILTLTTAPYAVDAFTVRYYVLDGKKASYSGMAETYRNYLVKEKGLKKNVHKPSLALEVYGALETKENILGVTYQKDQKLTTFSDTEDILASLKKSGINNIALQYVGWTNNGVFNRKYPVSASPLSALGGKSDFNSLKKYMDNNGVEYYMAADLVTFNKNRLGITINANSAKTTNGDNAELFEYSVVTHEKNREIPSWYLMRPQDLLEKSQKFIKNFKDSGLNSIALTNIGSSIYSDFAKKDGIFRSKSIEYFEEFVKGIDKEVKNVAVDGGNSYVVPYVSRVFDAPMTSSQYDIFTYDVPFYQMVLHGYINYTTCPVVQSVDRDSTLLKSIETGADLLFVCTGDDSYTLRETRLTSLYSSKFSIWKKTAVEFYKKNSKVNSNIWNETIVEHARVGDNLFKTVYSNGYTVYVNYSAETQTVDGIEVKAENYAVKEA